MSVKHLVNQYLNSGTDQETPTDKRVVSMRVSALTYMKLEQLAARFGVKKSTLAAELLTAAINEAFDETSAEKPRIQE